MAEGVAKLPAGYTAVPISEDQAGSIVRVCIVAGVGAGDEPPLVVLRSGFDAVTYLGCLVDGAGRIHEWLEISVQSVENARTVPQAVLESLSNGVLDERWRVFAFAAAALPGGRVYRTGFEERHPLPTWLDLDRGQPVHPMPQGAEGPWSLVTDEAALAAAGLPVYSATLHRVACAVVAGERRFASLTAGAVHDGGAAVAADLPEGTRLVPFNPAAGLLFVRGWAPVALDEFADALAAGVATSGLRVAPRIGPAPAVSPGAVGTHVFLATGGRWARLLEGLHLRLRVLADAVGAVREYVRRTHTPMLNLSPASFRVHVGEEGAALPVAWGARAVLVVPGEAVTLRAAAADVQHYLRASDAASVYFPDAAGRPLRGRGSVRLRQVEPGKGGGVMVSLTLQTHERLSPNPSDLAWIRLPMAGGSIDLSGTLESGAALAAGEWRFRSAPHRLPEASVDALRRTEGRTIPEVAFEAVPLLSTPCDLYSLGVVATRMLLVNRGNTLALALDEVLSLARQLAVDFDADRPLPERIAQIFAADRAWIEALGPQRLLHEDVSPEEAIEAVPPILWYAVLAMIVRMFPGVGPDSTCRDFGDARAAGLHTVFDRTRGDLDVLLLQSRSLIVNDTAANREIHAVVEGYLSGLSE